MSFEPPILWLIAGLLLCLLEFMLPTAFVELTMGISAILVGLLALWLPAVGVQVVIWLVLSIVLLVALRRLMPAAKSRSINDSSEAETLTEILPGQTGRVRYEGNSWRARCADELVTIAPKQKVYVVSRQGTTLIVMPEHLLHS